MSVNVRLGRNIINNISQVQLEDAFQDNLYHTFVVDNEVTPQMYGAKGDGVTDDTAAFQAALDSKLPVFIPQGVYNVKTLFPSNYGLKLRGQLKSSAYGTPTSGSIIRYIGNIDGNTSDALFDKTKISTEITISSTDETNGYISISNLNKPISVKINDTTYSITTYETVSFGTCSYRDISKRIYFPSDTNFVEGNTIEITYLSTTGVSANVEGIRFESAVYDTNKRVETSLFLMSYNGNFRFNTVKNFNNIFRATATAHILSNYLINIRGSFGFSLVDTTVSDNYINGTVDEGYAWKSCVVSFQCASSMFKGNYIDYFESFIPKGTKKDLTSLATYHKNELISTTVSDINFKYINFGAIVTDFNRVYVNGASLKIKEIKDASNPNTEIVNLQSGECAVYYNYNFNSDNRNESLKYARVYFLASEFPNLDSAEVEIDYSYANYRFLTSSSIVGNVFDEDYQIFVNTNIENIIVTGNTFFRINGTEDYNVEYTNRDYIIKYGLAYAPWSVCKFSGNRVENFNISNNSISYVNNMFDTYVVYYLNGFNCSNNEGSYIFYDSISGYVPNHTNDGFVEALYSFVISSIDSSNPNYKKVNTGKGVENKFFYCTQVDVRHWISNTEKEGYVTTKYKISSTPIKHETFSVDQSTGELLFAVDDDYIYTSDSIPNTRLTFRYIINYPYTIVDGKAELVYDEDRLEETALSSSNTQITDESIIFDPQLYGTDVETGDFILYIPVVNVFVYDVGSQKYIRYKYSTSDNGSGYICKLDRVNGTLIFDITDTNISNHIGGDHPTKISFNYYKNSNMVPAKLYFYDPKGLNGNNIKTDLLNDIVVSELPSTWKENLDPPSFLNTFPMQKVIYNGDYYINLPTYDSTGVATSSTWKKLTNDIQE